VKLLWLSSLACNGNAHSLLNHPRLESWMEGVEWLYHPLLPSTYSYVEVEEGIEGVEILILDGTIQKGLVKHSRPFEEIFERYARQAEWIVTVGTCATFGGIFREGGEGRSGLHFRGEVRRERYREYWEKTVSLPGCPVQPEVLTGTLSALGAGMRLPLDREHRPKHFYAYTVHNGCTRNEYFEYKVEEFRFGEPEGCMFYDYGCQGPFTRASCNRILWNSVSSKTRAGQPCMGCSEADFPRRGLWNTPKNMGIPARMPLGVPRRAYLSLAGVAKAFRIERFHRPMMEDES